MGFNVATVTSIICGVKKVVASDLVEPDAEDDASDVMRRRFESGTAMAPQKRKKGGARPCAVVSVTGVKRFYCEIPGCLAKAESRNLFGIEA